MFSTGHLIFIGISVLLIIVGVALCLKYRPPIDRMVKVCFVLALVSEVIKIFSVIEIVPVIDLVVENGSLLLKETGDYSAYMKMEHLPLELCSFQILFMFLILISKREDFKKNVYSVIYGTSIIGGMLALILSSIAPEFETAADFLSAPRAWQFFLYHSMIIVLGIYVGMSKECGLRFKDIKWTYAVLFGLIAMSLYLNSVMSVPLYTDAGNKVIGLTYNANFLSSYGNPVGTGAFTKGQFIFRSIKMLSIACASVFALYLPLLKRKEKTEE